MLKDKVLISCCSYNQPWFLSHFVDSFERCDPGSACDLLIWDNSSTDKEQLKLLERIAKKYRIEVRPNYGRAQGSYNDTWQNNKDYKYYFFLHDDSGFIRNNWLKKAIERMNHCPNGDWGDDYKWTLPVGKVGFQGYEWGDKYKYFRTSFPQIFKYMDPIAKILDIVIPEAYQHIADDRFLIKNELLEKMGKIWNIEDFKQMELNKDERWQKIDNWFKENKLENYDPFVPYERYGSPYHKFQTVSEFISDIAPMRYGFRTHNVCGPGFCQEEMGWKIFWGNEWIVHYGDHVVFKRLSLLFKQPEEVIRKRFKDKTFLNICDNIIRKETNFVESFV